MISFIFMMFLIMQHTAYGSYYHQYPRGGVPPNWKQCAWRIAVTKDVGLIQNCVFNKRYDDTSLRVSYGGNLAIYHCDNCCSRWYFKINGNECKNPMAIDGVFLMSKGLERSILRHRNIEGYCNGIPKGTINVGFWVGKCALYGTANPQSGWGSVSRIVVEEVPPPQA